MLVIQRQRSTSWRAGPAQGYHLAGGQAYGILQPHSQRSAIQYDSLVHKIGVYPCRQ